jgi:hypothetical protein
LRGSYRAAKDENAVFIRKKSAAEFGRLRDAIESAIA